MEQRLANNWRMTVNEKNFIKTSLLANIRADGRGPLDYRRLVIEFGREDGTSEVQLGQTHVMGFVTSQLLQPYRDRPNEGTLAIFTEFSPMADPSFEPGRPTESAVELGRIIDRGLRESRAVDMESLCVVAGKLVWAIRVDLHILDNCGNLVDAANIAALAALSTFRRPECTLGGEDGQEVTIHPAEVKEPLPLIIHHLPIAVTFGFFDNGDIMVIDPTYFEEAVTEGRMTATLNTNGEVCAIQKAGGVGVINSSIISCLRFASVKAADITSKIKNAVESYNTARALRKIKRHPTSTALNVSEPCTKLENRIQALDFKATNDTALQHMEISGSTNQSNSLEGENRVDRKRDGHSMSFSGGPSSWDPYSKGVHPEVLKSSLASRGTLRSHEKVHENISDIRPEEILDDDKPVNLREDLMLEGEAPEKKAKTLKDAVKPKHKRKKNVSST